MTITANKWYDRVQGGTLAVADHHYEQWTKEELETVLAFTNEVTDEELALTLGRTLHAVSDIQWRIKRGEITVRSVAAMRTPAPAREVCSSCFTERAASGDCLCS